MSVPSVGYPDKMATIEEGFVLPKPIIAYIWLRYDRIPL
jgi:hypothetical protein